MNRRAYDCSVTFSKAHQHFLTALRKNPATPRPAVRTGTVADFHAWKAEVRAHDQARLDLNLVTPQQLQEMNAAVRVDPKNCRIVRHEQYA